MSLVPASPMPAIETAQVLKIAPAGAVPAVIADTFRVAIEAPLRLDIEDAAVYAIMCSPVDIEALALGFLFSQGVIASACEVDSMESDTEYPLGLRIRLKEQAKAKARKRHSAIVSAGGVSEGRSHNETLEALPGVTDTLRAAPELPRRMCEVMKEQQIIYPQSGGTHAIAIFSGMGELMAFAEDIGRHNAMDKAVGKCLAAGYAPAGGCAALSGRVSAEMVAKCAQAGLELISAVSAPTSLAVEAARRCGITLCALVREGHAVVFTCPHRIEGLTAGARDPVAEIP